MAKPEEAVERKQVREKDIKYEDVPAFTRYMKKKMTGLEAFKVMYHCLGRWGEISQNEYVIWLVQNMERDPALWADFERSIKEMIENREESGCEYLAWHEPQYVYKPCEHCKEE